MSFTIFVDGSSNLPGRLLSSLDIHVLPCSFTLNGEPREYKGDVDSFDFHTYYDMLRQGAKVETTLLNTHLFLSNFRPEVEAGRDVLYFGMSSGISGTVQAAKVAAQELTAEFPERTVRVIDSLGSGFGTGLLACDAADMRAEGHSAKEAADKLDIEATKMLQFFTVDDLNFLRRTGRLSGTSALLGTMLQIKPILWGDPTGHISVYAKYRGRKRVLDAMAQEYAKRARNPKNSRVAISHGDCPEDAEELAARVRAIAEPCDLIICPHEPFTGAHVGPGMLALFFQGDAR